MNYYLRLTMRGKDSHQVFDSNICSVSMRISHFWKTYYCTQLKLSNWQPCQHFRTQAKLFPRLDSNFAEEWRVKFELLVSKKGIHFLKPRLSLTFNVSSLKIINCVTKYLSIYRNNLRYMPIITDLMSDWENIHILCIKFKPFKKNRTETIVKNLKWTLSS